MSALPVPRPSEWTVSAPPPRPTRSLRKGTARERSPHTRLVHAVLDLFPGSEVVEHHPAPRPEGQGPLPA